MLAAPVYAKAYKTISVDKAYSMMFIEDHPDLVVIDLRAQVPPFPYGYDSGHIAGAINVPVLSPAGINFDALDTWMESTYGQSLLNSKIIVYCVAGAASPVVAAYLSDGGFKKVYSMEGGILAWVAAEYPIVV